MVAGWVVLAHVAARLLARQVLRGSLGYGDAVEYLRTQMEVLRWFALPVTLLCHYGFSLAAWLRVQPVLENSMAIQSIGLLAPGLTLLVATWSAEFWFAAMIGIQTRSMKNYFGTLLRLLRAGPAWLLVPTLVFLALGDLVSIIETDYLATWAGLSEESEGWTAWGLLGIGVVAMVLVFPWAVRRIAKTQPVSEPHRIEVETWLRRCGISTDRFFGMQVARWETGGRMLNAMVAGLVRPGRLLLLSDRLLDELPRGQRLMVVMHELAHVRRFHVPLRMAAILPAWFVSSWTTSLLIDNGLLDTSFGAAVGGVVGLLTTVLALGLVSHWSELDADAVACRLAVRACDPAQDAERAGQERTGADPAPHADSTAVASSSMTAPWAAELLEDALTRVTADHPSSRRFSWLHPSLATRVGRLRRISRPLPDPASDRHTLLV